MVDDAADGWESFGMQLWRGVPGRMPGAHQHDEIELNLVTAGALTYTFGGERLTFAAGTLAAFWGVRPHRLEDVAPGTACAWLTLPLTVFLRLGLPEAFTATLLGGWPVTSSAGFRLAQARFDDWEADRLAVPACLARVLECEALALLLRFAGTAAPAGLLRAATGRPDRAAALARVIAREYTSPVTAADVARRVHLNPNYAATLYRQVFGQTITQSLTRHRLAHAQRLLLTTAQPVAAIALDSGFQSLSRFYAAFRAQVGQTPQAYRAGRAARS